jgi:hypothetical protein
VKMATMGDLILGPGPGGSKGNLPTEERTEPRPVPRPRPAAPSRSGEQRFEGLRAIGLPGYFDVLGTKTG